MANYSNVISFDNIKHPYFEFSNYYPHDMVMNIKNNYTNKVESISFNSIEQYYQSEKYNTNNKLSQFYRSLILQANTPKKAHLLGKQTKFIYDWNLNKDSKLTIKGIINKYKGKVKIRDDWKEAKNKILLKGLKNKFNDDRMKKILLSTNNKVLVENSVGRWGMKNNKLGECLMKVRDFIRNKNK